MKSLALSLLFALSNAQAHDGGINITNVYSDQDREVEGFTIIQAQSQEECDARSAHYGVEGAFTFD